MAVARKLRIEDALEAKASPRVELRRVRPADRFAPVPNPIADQLIRLEDAFSQNAANETPRYPGRVRLAIMIGAPLALWGLIACAAMGLSALF